MDRNEREVKGFAENMTAARDRIADVKKSGTNRMLRDVCGMLAFAMLAFGHARAQIASPEAQVTFCKIEIPRAQQENKDTVAFKFRVNLQGGATGISIVRRGGFVIDERPFRECIAKWVLPVTDQQYLATFSTHDSAVWQEIDVDSKTFHRKLNAQVTKR